jgi:endonuclease YncB( thermonuclease family)
VHLLHAERIRLNGIDCPEKGQAYGKKAKQAASELVFGKEVTLQTHDLRFQEAVQPFQDGGCSIMLHIMTNLLL